MSGEFIEFARRRLPDRHIIFRTGDALNFLRLDHPMDVAVAGLALNFIPEPVIALQSLGRVLQAGGVLAFYVWD